MTLRIPIFALSAVCTLASASQAQSIAPNDAYKYIGKNVTVCGLVVGTKYVERSKRQPTLLNLDKQYPDHIFTVVIYKENRAKFGEPEKSCLRKNICVTGNVKIYRGKPEIIVNDRDQLKGC